MSQDFRFLGLGYDTFAGEKKQKLLDVEMMGFDGTETFHMKVCESEEDIFKSLDVKASLGVSYKGFDLDAKASYASELSAKKNSVTILFVATKSRKGRVTRSTFNKQQTSTVELFRQGGDSYIEEVEEGGVYVASYQFESSTQDQKRTIAADCKAKYKGQVEANISVEMKEIAKSRKVEYTFDQRNFGGTGVAAGPENVSEFGREFLKTALSAPIMLRFTTASYLSVKDCPAGFDKIAEYTKAYNKVYFDQYKYSLAAIARQADVAKAKSLAVRVLYDFYQVKGPLAGIDGHLQKIDTLRAAIKKFKDAFKPDSVPDPRQNMPKLDLSSLNVPTVTFDFIKGPWSGTEKGTKWQTWDEKKYWIYNFVFPQRISANGAKVLQRLVIVYAKRARQNESGFVEIGSVESGGLYGSFEMPEVDTVANLGPGEVVSIGAWFNTLSNQQYVWKDKVSGLYIQRNRGGDMMDFRLIGREGAIGGGYYNFDKKDDTTFAGFEGYDDFVASGSFMPTRVITGIRAVYIKFAHNWQTPQMPDEY